MSHSEKLHFLKSTFPSLLRAANPNAERKWGKMNLQQMIEHMSEAVKMANGKDKYELVTPAEKVPAMYAFMSSEKEFKPDTKNVLMAEEPVPVKHASIEEAIKEFEAEVNDFEKYYVHHPEGTLVNPFFGTLNYTDWVQLLHKHATHHAKQFGLI